jgi:hypothetical protein
MIGVLYSLLAAVLLLPMGSAQVAAQGPSSDESRAIANEA